MSGYRPLGRGCPSSDLATASRPAHVHFSGFFADLLDSTHTEPVLTKTPIELPAGFFAVKDFLEFAYTGRLGWEVSTTFEEFKDGLELANFLRVPVLEAAYLRILCQSKMTTSRPWDCFVLAAQKGNLHLARQSIKAFSTTGSDNPAMQLPFLTKEAEKVPLDWMQELMRRRIKQEPATDRTQGKRYSEVPWETVSQLFMSGKPVGDPVSKVSTPKSVKVSRGLHVEKVLLTGTTEEVDQGKA